MFPGDIEKQHQAVMGWYKENTGNNKELQDDDTCL